MEAAHERRLLQQHDDNTALHHTETPTDIAAAEELLTARAVAESLNDCCIILPPKPGNDCPPNYSQAVGIDPPPYSEAVSPPVTSAYYSSSGGRLRGECGTGDPGVQIFHVGSPPRRRRNRTLDVLLGSLFKGLERCNLLLIAILCLAVFAIVILSLEAYRKPVILLNEEHNQELQTISVPLRLNDRVSSFTFINNNTTYIARTKNIEKCDNDIGLLTINHFSWAPQAVKFGQPVSVDMSAALHMNLNMQLRIEVKLKKYIGFFVWWPVPCLSNVGSCTYSDVCSWFPPELPGQSCEKPLIPNSNFPCSCPINSGSYYISQGVVKLPDNITMPSWLNKGRYSAKIKLVSTRTELIVSCYVLEFNVD